MKITSSKSLKRLKDGNKFLGYEPEFVNTIIEFNGKNNIFYCDKNVKLVDTNIIFNGDNSIVFLSSNTHKYELYVFINNNSVFFMGKNNYMNGTLHVLISERKHCLIGNNCLFSTDIWIRNADPHLIYDISAMKRINSTKSVFIGDHVWIGQSALLLKGTRIDSGSIIGAMSVVSGKKIANNSIWAGNPVRMVKKNIFWNESCVHKWNTLQTKKSKEYSEFIAGKDLLVDEFIYKYDKTQVIDYNNLDKLFDSTDKDYILKELIKINKSNDKNRFVHKIKKQNTIIKNKITRKVKKSFKRIVTR